MPEKVLIYSRFPKAQMERFGERFELLNAAGKAPNEVFSADQLADISRDDHGRRHAAWRRRDGPDAEARAIVCYGTGYDGVDLAAAAKRKIAVGHSPGANAASVADIAVTLMLAATRRLLVADDYVRGGELGGGKTLADDAPAGRHARPQNRRLRHGRDRPQDRGARRRLRDRGRLFQPQPARRALSIFSDASMRWRNGAAS